jgi:hypothetical protein
LILEDRHMLSEYGSPEATIEDYQFTTFAAKVNADALAETLSCTNVWAEHPPIGK